MEKEKKKIHKIFANMRTESMIDKVKFTFNKDFGSVSNGVYVLCKCYVDRDFFSQLLKFEEIKRDQEIMSFRIEEMKKVERENKLLSRKIKLLLKETDSLQKHVKQLNNEIRGLKDEYID